MSNLKQDNKLEKHYTGDYLLNRLYEIASTIPNTECYLENSAGSGNIIDNVIKKFDKPYLAFDIFNETNREDILQVDYLKHKIDYVPNRVAIINPPFTKGLKFVYKALEESDWCIAILAHSSLLNLDYNKYWIIPEEVELYENFKFEKTTVSIVILKIRKKTEQDNYEYEYIV